MAMAMALALALALAKQWGLEELRNESYTKTS
jgi:hypothetical protein